MRKRSLLIIISIIVIGFVILGLYSTFATNISTESKNVYNITLTEKGSEVSVPAGGSKTVIYRITNTNKGTVKYGIAYAGDNIEVKVYGDSKDKITGNIDYGETKFVKLYIKNNGTSTSTASIKSVFGYKNGGELSGSNIVPSGHTVVTKVYTPLTGLAKYITNLYLNNKDEELVENNEILYGYASIYDNDTDPENITSGGLMNDRFGAMSVGEDTGNIRYYGANPSNYIFFNCNDYTNQALTDSEGKKNCELWRIIGVFDGKVKIMRNSILNETFALDYNKNNLNGTSTDISYNNDWSNSSLQEFLNGKYYDRGEDETWTYYNASDASSSVSVNLKDQGITTATREANLISETLWYLKGWNNASIYSDQMYDYERNSGNVAVTGQPTTLPRNIGIPYASDYGYAVDFGSCVSKPLSSYNDTTCTSTNWMKPILVAKIFGWLMTPRSDISGFAYNVQGGGNVVHGIYGIAQAGGVAPVLHLNSELDIEAGDGSQDNPYQLDVN